MSETIEKFLEDNMVVFVDRCCIANGHEVQALAHFAEGFNAFLMRPNRPAGLKIVEAFGRQLRRALALPIRSERTFEADDDDKAFFLQHYGGDMPRDCASGREYMRLFLRRCCIINPQSQSSVADLYRAYIAFDPAGASTSPDAHQFFACGLVEACDGRYRYVEVLPSFRSPTEIRGIALRGRYES